MGRPWKRCTLKWLKILFCLMKLCINWISGVFAFLPVVYKQFLSSCVLSSICCLLFFLIITVLTGVRWSRHGFLIAFPWWLKTLHIFSYIFIGHLYFFQVLFVQFTCHTQNETRPWFSAAFEHSQYSFVSEALLQWSLRTLTGLWRAWKLN